MKPKGYRFYVGWIEVQKTSFDFEVLITRLNRSEIGQILLRTK